MRMFPLNEIFNSFSWREKKVSDVELKSHLRLNFKTEEICNIGNAREQEKLIMQEKEEIIIKAKV